MMLDNPNTSQDGAGASQTESELLARARSALKLPDEAQFSLERATRDAQGGQVLEYSVTAPVTLQGEEFGPADGVTVDEPASARVQVDAEGQVVSAQVTPADPRHLQLVKDNVRKLVAAGQIATEPPGRSPRGGLKPWHVVTDKDGRKRLKRASIS